MPYSSYTPITLPRRFWPDEEQYNRTAAEMRARGITPPPRGVLDPMATAALGRSLYEQEGFLDNPAKIAAIVMGGAAAGGALGGGVASSGTGGFVPGGTAVGGTNLASIGMRGAGLLGSGLMAGKGGGGGGAGDASAIQSQLAMQLIEQTDPLRRALIGRSEQFLNGGLDNSAQFSAFKAAAEPQFASARDNIIANTPSGGALTAALTNLDASRARALTEARGGIEESELARAMALGTGMTGQSLSTLGNAANTQAMIAQSEADREAGMLGALGAGAGAYFGSKA